MSNPTIHANNTQSKVSPNQNKLMSFLDTFPTKTLKKGSVILNPQTVENQVKYLMSGIVREFYVTDKKELNLDFFEAKEFITDCVSMHNAITSKKWQECVTDVEIKIIPREKFEAFLRQHEGVDATFKAGFLGLLTQRETREFSRLTKDPEELYQELLETKPNWIQNIPQYHIASYLGISPETLSRIRKRMCE